MTDLNFIYIALVLSFLTVCSLPYLVVKNWHRIVGTVVLWWWRFKWCRGWTNIKFVGVEQYRKER